MTRITHILYDLGNTLLYFDGDWADVFSRAVSASAQALAPAGLDAIDAGIFEARFAAGLEAYYRRRDEDMVETSTPVVLRQTLAGLGWERVPDEAVDTILGSFYAISQACWKRVPGALETLAALQARGFHQAVLSNAAYDRDVRTLVSRAALGDFLDFVLTSAQIGMRKPHILPFRSAMTAWAIPAGQVLMIGDTPSADISGAAAAGIRSVWVRRYSLSPPESAGAADAIIESVVDLPALLSREFS